MLAITEAVKKWKHYLIGTHFQIITDQQSLKGLLTKACSTPEQQKWATKLIGYSFEIMYLSGLHNQATNFLFRPPTSFFFGHLFPNPRNPHAIKNILPVRIGETRSTKSHNYSKQRLYLSKTTFCITTEDFICQP